jgi:DNA-binding HxlR family transcriptional regulator
MAGGNKQKASDDRKPVQAQVREPGRFAYDGLARVIHEKARLSILSSLASHADGLLFNDLKALCALTDGNLSRQLQVLQEAGFVEVWKGFRGKRPQTLCRLTPDGRKRFIEYITTLESVVSDAMAAAQRDGKASRLSAPEGFMPA